MAMRRERTPLDPGRTTGAMLWIMAIMVFLTVLATALGLATHRTALSLDRQLSGRLTVQVIEGDAARRDAAVAAITGRVRAIPGVTRVAEVDRERLAELLSPWLGDVGLDPDLPMPAMIDVDLADGGDERLAAIELVVRQVSPGSRVDRHATWLAPVRAFVGSLTLLAAGLVALMLIATGAVVLLSAKSGLDTHRDTIEVLHMLGSTDVQLSRLFQRRIGADTLIGGSIGAAAGILVVLLLQGRIATLDMGIAQDAALLPADWAALALVPLFFAALAMLAARVAVVRTLGRTL